jgi:recombinational DNA repair ATPase RecF
MTLSIVQLSAQVAKRFPNVEKVSDSVLRFTRKAGDQPFAVYYLDVAENLPSTPESLNKYQDQIIGQRYFEEAQSLQWSNYLYFILSKQRLATIEARHAKELIENDRNYARKFVIAEEELDRVLAPPAIVRGPAVPKSNIHSIWLDRLVKAGIDKAILSEDSLPRRLTRIELSTPAVAPSVATPRAEAQSRPEPFLSSLRLNHYRQFPQVHLFEFANVNLVYGPNATGKTSLLEAIELFYCGRTKRNPDKQEEYEIVGVLSDGRTEKATNLRRLKEFRRRHLAWYGQSEIKTNELYLSFGQFNFLDTDAAVGLAESTANIEDDLSKLLVGSETSKTWHNMERVREAIDGQLRNLRPLQSQISDELKLLQKQAKDAASIEHESDAIRAQLEQFLRRLNWEVPKGAADSFAAKLIALSSELTAVARQAANLSWVSSPISIEGLERYCRSSQDLADKAEAAAKNLETVQTNQSRIVDSIYRRRETLSALSEVQTYLTAGVPERIAERGRLRETIAANTNLVSGFDDAFIESISNLDPKTSLRSCLRNVTSARRATEKELAVRRVDYNNFTKLRDQSVKLRQQLREIAVAILDYSENKDECPLCHTRFKPGEFAQHMKAGVDGNFNNRSEALLAQIRKTSTQLESLAEEEAALVWLADFCNKSALGSEVAVDSALAHFQNISKQLDQARSRLDILNRDIQALESKGYSLDKHEALMAQLAMVEHAPKVLTPGAINRMISATERDLQQSAEQQRLEFQREKELKDSLTKLLGGQTSDISNFTKSISNLRERIAVARGVQKALSDVAQFCPWPGRKPIVELVVAAEYVRRVASELQLAFSKEKVAKTTQEESKKRNDQLVRQLADVQPRIKRYEEALAVLGDLHKNYSLADAMKSALSRNRAEIESIFARIHSPAEFSGLGKSITTLVRKINGAEVNLSQISTGQRSAFGLSVFLAQNSQLTVAPPVVLIDDPIAHVDDLNSLSFLDYLREIALSGGRQIFFATASDKLATLFQRKFDFLGSKGFRRFNLTRERPDPRLTKLH